MNNAQRNTEIANEILRQLGGGRFTLMTGARNLTAVDNGLKMVLPNTKYGKSRISVNGSIFTLTVTLTPMDTYTVKLDRVKAFQVVETWEEEDIYCDTLQGSFERLTGLYTKL